MLRHLFSWHDPSRPIGPQLLSVYRRRSRFAAISFFCLTISIIALAFILGLMLGWSGAERTTRARFAMPAATPPEAPAAISSTLVPASLKSPPPHGSLPSTSPTDLVIYEHGKEIFRQGPARRTPNSKPKAVAHAANPTKDPSPVSQ